ncbi:unnamed protein product, partial [Symbiodinium microadriaticum]
MFRKSLLDFVSSGKGLVGFHAASDANYHWEEFGKLIGGYFDQHPWHEKVGIKVDSPDHPLMAAFGGEDFAIVDEIYQFRDPYSRDALHVLLSLDVDKTNMDKKNIKRKDGDFAVSWVRSYGDGRVFYSSLGHREEIYWNPQMLKFYLDGIQNAPMSYRFARPLLTMLFVLAVAGTSFAEEKAKLKGLLITGGCCHDYPAQIKIITEGLSQRVNIEWDVVIAGDGRQVKVPVYLNHDWIKPYDVVFHNECYGHVDDVEFVEGIVKAHTENNIPAIFVHCSMHSYRNAKTDEWRKLIGMRSTSHEGKHPLDIVTLESDHPIMQGFPKDWKVDRGELYKIEKTWDSATPLAKAYG